MSELLALGSKGPAVSKLQGDLNARMPDVLPALATDGDFGPKTDARVRVFQARVHIRVDGIVGPATEAALEARPIQPIAEENPKLNGLLIGGKIVPVPGIKVIGPADAAWAHLSPGDASPRVALKGRGCPDRPQMWIWHKTIADDPEKLKPGKGPAGGARRTADWWREDPHYSGTQLVTGHEGEVACLGDLRDLVAWHATVSNFYAVGQETCEESGGYFYEAALEATLASTWVGCEALGIQIQIPKLGSYKNNHPFARMKFDGGRDCVGIFGHCHNTDDRNINDPGVIIFERAAARGAEQFDYEARQDLEVWKERQRELNKHGHNLVVDGIAGAATAAALLAEGYRGGIWINGRSNFHG